MDKFKETVMVNALTNNPMSITFEMIDNFYNLLDFTNIIYYTNLLSNTIDNSNINNNYTDVLKAYITNKITNILDL